VIIVDRKSLFGAFLIMSISQIVYADDIGLTEQYSACMDKAAGVTANMTDCIGIETKLQDTRLNKAYKEVIGQISPSRKKELQDVQRSWIKYREANCNFYADPDGGTMAALNANDCFMSATALRAKEIEGFKE
jgi:uncharacterized protein YecT (DUF1311 family)